MIKTDSGKKGFIWLAHASPCSEGRRNPNQETETDPGGCLQASSFWLAQFAYIPPGPLAQEWH